MRIGLQWETAPYKPKDRIADLPSVGRYYIKRYVGRGKRPSRVSYQLSLNAIWISSHESGEEAIGAAERHAYKYLHGGES